MKIIKLQSEVEMLLSNTPTDIVIFDFETTGLSAEKNRPTQLAAIHYRYDPETTTFTEIKCFNEFVNCGQEINAFLEEKIGITNEFIRKQQLETEFFSKVQDFFNLDDFVQIGYNVPFDIRFMNALYERNNGYYPNMPSIDVCKVVKELISSQDVPNYKQETIHPYLFPNKVNRYHDALNDVESTKDILEYCLLQYKGLKKEEQEPKEKVELRSYNRWTRSHTLDRIYISLKYNGFINQIYYDIYKKEYFEKDTVPHLLEEIDLDDLERQILDRAGCNTFSEIELAS